MTETIDLLTAKTESVSTHDLQNGDMIRFYGVVLELRDRKEWGVTAPHTEELHGQVITFKTNIIDQTQNNGFIPQSWLNDWTVQGNKLARWARIVR